jgi:hypothetical protein
MATSTLADPQEDARRDAERLNGMYASTESWAMKALILVSLSQVDHPDALAIFRSIFDDKDKRLKGFAVEAMARMRPDVLKSGMTKELLVQLIKREMKHKNKYYVDQVKKILKAAIGEDFERQTQAQNWWRDNEKTWTPSPFAPKPPPEPKPNADQITDDPGATPPKTTTVEMFRKLFDLNETGIELMVVMDATGSMQPTIDAAVQGVDDLATIIQAIVPKFKIGLVYYRDFEDMKDGAELDVSLTPKYGVVKKALDDLDALGGGDFPERVEKGLEQAINNNKVGWSPSAAKVVVVIGDAPPHPEVIDDACKLVKEARNKPFGRAIVESGPVKKRITPFVTNTIAVSQGTRANPQTEEAFQKIADAGGGKYTVLANSEDIAQQILLLSFGEEWEPFLGPFIEWYKTLREQKLVQ